MTEHRFSPSAVVRGRVFRYSIPALAVAAFLGYAVAMLHDFEYDIGHFAMRAPAVILCGAACVLSILFAVIRTAVTYKRTAFTEMPDKTSYLTIFTSVLGAGLCIGMFFQNLAHYAEIAASTTAGEMPGIPPAKLYFWSSLFGLFLAASLILKLFPATKHHPGTAICATLGAFSVNIAMFAAYFDFEIPLNSPVRNFTTLVEASALLFLLSEARLAIVKDKEKLPPAFQLLGSTLCATITFGISLAAVVYRLIVLGSNPQPEPNLPLVRLALYTCLGLAAMERAFTYLRLLRDLTPEEIAEAKAKAKAEKEKRKHRKSDAENDTTTNND